jgi:hypothetical protein
VRREALDANKKRLSPNKAGESLNKGGAEPRIDQLHRPVRAVPFSGVTRIAKPLE